MVSVSYTCPHGALQIRLHGTIYLCLYHRKSTLRKFYGIEHGMSGSEPRPPHPSLTPVLASRGVVRTPPRKERRPSTRPTFSSFRADRKCLFTARPRPRAAVASGSPLCRCAHACHHRRGLGGLSGLGQPEVLASPRPSFNIQGRMYNREFLS